jgi:RNA polymerase sigma factor (sigma-70 family)
LDDEIGSPTHERALASHHGFVRELARGLVAPDAFEDVAHEALLAGLARPPARPAALRGWLATTVRHLASKWRRGEARRERREAAAARPEALPSARELVERVELEQAVVRAVLALKEPFRTTVLLRFYEGHATAAIAQQMRIPADTVRARLRRGLAELRAKLDASCGSRDHWVAALLPVAALPSGVVPIGSGVVTAKAATAAAATGAAVMGIQAIGIVAASCATAALAWWIVPESWLERALAPAATASAAHAERGAADGIGAPRIGVAGAHDDALAATRAAESAAGVSDGEAAKAASLPPPGTVLMEVVDACTLVRLDGVKIRFLNESRFAEYDGSGGVQTVLTAGRWEAIVGADGYEPLRLATFDVVVGEARSVGRIALDRGNGVVEGRVVARQLPGDVPVTVELFGAGRSPCDACLAALNRAGDDDAERLNSFGADCGFTKERDVFEVTGDRSFRFGHLAAGVYFLRASDPRQKIVEACRLEVGRGGCVWQELDVSAPTFARFELRHERGGIFSGAWSSPHQPQPARIRYEFRRDGKPVGSVEFTPSADDTLASVGPPIVIPGGGGGTSHPVALAVETLTSRVTLDRLDTRLIAHDVAVNFVPQVESQWIRGLAVDASKSTLDTLFANFDLPSLERIDRERQEGDALRFDGEEPGCDGAALKLEALRPDLHEIAPLPRLELTLVVTCGDYQSEELPVDLRGDYFQPQVVTMKMVSGPGRASALSQAMGASCSACHAETAQTAGASLEASFWKLRSESER